MFLGTRPTGLVVPDLEAVRALFASLGFHLTPRELLTRPGSDGKPVSTGAENHVFMRARGYQEVIAVTDPAAGHMLVPRIARYAPIFDPGQRRGAGVTRLWAIRLTLASQRASPMNFGAPHL